jgi:hypothetical protein
LEHTHKESKNPKTSLGGLIKEKKKLKGNMEKLKGYGGKGERAKVQMQKTMIT